MKLAYPLKGNHPVTGRFEKRTPIYINGVWTLPFHYGIDWSAPAGTPIYAAHDGTVEVSGWDSTGYGGGNEVKLVAGKHATWYLHMQKPSHLKKGDRVKQGDLIGYVGSTGLSTGNHLHFEHHINGVPVNPEHSLTHSSSTGEDEMTIYIRRNNQSKVYAYNVGTGTKRPIDTWEWENIKKAYGTAKLSLPIVNVSAKDAERYGI